jgi:formyltetrahydrofolate-dependent phosphoribosylglycinamide formyltransferase
MRSRVAVLASGGGSNLQAIVDHFAWLGDRRGGDVVLVASSRPDAGALERARRAKLPTGVVDAGDDAASSLDTLLRDHEVDLIVLAGYLKLVPSNIIARFTGRVLNVHPALLPAFGGRGMYGQRVHRAVLAAGARVTGVTIHFVDEVYDQGRIIAQWPVPVFANDDAGTLASRVLRVEHLVYPRIVDAVAAGRTTLANCGPTAQGTLMDARPAFTLLPHEDSRLAENIELALGC